MNKTPFGRKRDYTGKKKINPQRTLSFSQRFTENIFCVLYAFSEILVVRKNNK